MALESVNNVDDTIVLGYGSQLFRYNLNGTVDTTFGSNGVATLPSGYSVNAVLAEPQVGGDIIVQSCARADCVYRQWCHRYEFWHGGDWDRLAVL